MYQLPALPLKWFASHRKENAAFTYVLKTYNVNSDLLTMMSILELTSERPLVESDLNVELPSKKTKLGEFIKTRVQVQKLSITGIRLAELYLKKRYQQGKNYLFLILLKRKTNERLPDFFARTVQTPSLFDHLIQAKEFMEIMHTKKPETDHIFLWTKFFGMNVSPKSNSMILDRRWVIYYLFHAHLQVAADLIRPHAIPTNKYFAYNMMRSLIEKELHILPNGLSVDGFVQMLEEIAPEVKNYRIGWEPDRELFVGTGHMGNPKRARMTIVGELPPEVKKSTVDKAADQLGLLRGV